MSVCVQVCVRLGNDAIFTSFLMNVYYLGCMADIVVER